MSTPAGALTGRSVIVTRATEQSGGLVAMLEAHGAQVTVVPLIEVVAPADGGVALAAALARVASYDWVVVTSPNAAERVVDALGHRPPLVAAVGTATAAALGAVDLVPQRQSAAGLLDELPAVPGRILLPQSARAHPTLADGLRARGWSVDVVEAYDVASREPDEAQRAAVRHAEALLLASGSAARSWVEAFGTDAPPIVAAIGPQTTSVARELGLKVHLTATDHSPAGLVTVLVEHLRRP